MLLRARPAWPRPGCTRRLLRLLRVPTRHAYHDTPMDRVRNVGIIAHVDAGKTTTTERMLYYSGVSRHLGNVDHGDTVTDFLPMERARGITIQSAAISFRWPPGESGSTGSTDSGATINLIDTPGHQDFRFEVDRCLPVLDGAVCIIDAVKGVEAHTERVWASAQEHSLPRLAYVNKLDRDGASFRRSVRDIATRLGAWPAVVQLPLWDRDVGGEVLVGVVDVIARRAVRYGGGGATLVSSSALQATHPVLWDEMQTARGRLVEALCEHDEALVEAFCEAGTTDLPTAEIKAALRRVVLDARGGRAGRLVPVLAGSSLRNIGVEPLLDAVVDYLPSPAEAPAVPVRVGTADPVPLDTDNTDGAIASVFKVVHDATSGTGSGTLAFVRVYAGRVTKGVSLWNANLQTAERALQVAQVSAARIGDVPFLARGQIGALTGLKAARTGDTLHLLPRGLRAAALEARKTTTIRAPSVGPAVAFVHVEAYGGATETRRLADALDKLAREDPSLRVARGVEPGAEDTFVLSGLGQLHLDVAMDRLRTTYGMAGAHFSGVQVDYKECLLEATPAYVSVYDRVVAGKPGSASVTVQLEPGGDQLEQNDTENATFRFTHDGNEVVVEFTADGEVPDEVPSGAVIARQLFNGACGALARGPRRGSPVQGVRVRLSYDVGAHGSTTDAHVVHAALQGVRASLRSAHSRQHVAVLEPVMLVHISCPDDCAGAVQRDIAGARGGCVLEIKDGSATAGGLDADRVYAPPDPYTTVQSLRQEKTGMTRLLEVVAKVPLKEMLAYDQRLRSITGGRHSFTMELASFDRVVGAREREL